jgi:hypothetical protein
MTNDFKYPSSYELKEVLSTMTQRSFINDFAKSRGIFVTNVKHDELASELTNFFYEENDLEVLRDEAFQKSDNASLSSFIVSSPYKDFDLTVKYDTITQNGLYENGLIPSSLRKADIAGNTIFIGEIEYNKSKVGRIQFLQNEQTNFGFSIQKVKDGIWKVEVDCTRSNDLTQIKKLFENNVREDDAEFNTIDYKALTTEQTVNFFDLLGKKALSDKWSLRTVSHIFIKQDNDKKSEMDDEVSEIDNPELVSDISQAMLKGKNLRNNKVVEDFVKTGYRFTAMTFEFLKINTPQIIHITAEFKGVARQFEVSVIYAGELSGYESIEPTEVPITKEYKQLRSEVWNNAKDIFDSLKKGK